MSKTADIARRIGEALGTPRLSEQLGSLSGAALKSLLMRVFQLRSGGRRPADLARQARRDATVEPCAVPLRQLFEVDRHALAAAGEFEALDLSMLQPLGTSTALGEIDQNSVLATIAGTEIVADPTSALALEAARRRRGDQLVRLCTSQRVLRMQPLDNPSFTRHFRLFAAVSAGRDRGAERFEMAAMRDHLGLYLRMLESLAAAGYRTGAVAVEVADTRLTQRLAAIAGLDLATLAVRADAPRDCRDRFVSGGVDLPASITDPVAELGPLAADRGLDRELDRLVRIAAEVFAPLAARHRSARFAFAPFRLVGARYYQGYCFHVQLVHPERGPITLGDGGFLRWTAQLLGNRKERMLGSGIATEVICKLFAPV